MQEKRSGWTYAAFATAILLSSFLIFQVQPLISKYILPWFGGTPGVWSTCMLFFQVVLFAGYAYAHLLIRYLTPRNQCLVHFSLVIVAILLLPIAPAATWKPLGAEDPTWRILGLLAASVGLPYFLLSANGPLMQAWFSRAKPGASPYGLYSLSNIGSVLGLVTYPFIVEPLLTVETQAGLWSASFKLYALFCLVCAIIMRRAPRVAPVASAARSVTVSRGDRWLWFALPACASVMLLATTNQVCLDVAAIPFLWVLPLTLYLMTFILSFGNPIWYPRRAYAAGLVVAMVCLCAIMQSGERASLFTQVFIYFAALFVCCMVCHGEMVRLKPEPAQLTSFYMTTSAGGACGGVFVGLIAPHVFSQFVELHIGMFACCLLALVVFFRDQTWVLHAGKPRWAWMTLLVAMLLLARVLKAHAGEKFEGELTIVRNFYGVLRVVEGRLSEPQEASRILVHGRILHGRQFLAADKQNIPTAYYGEEAGIGLALQSSKLNKRVGIVGLGVGTLAAYGKPDESWKFYEINPDVVRLAKEHFTYLKNCPSQVEHILGDARLSLEREAPQNFDVLAIDAFSSDAIPTHLLTEEAFAIYLRHLADEGILALHISNRHFDLQPVVEAAARRFDLSATLVASKPNAERGQGKAMWMLLARSPKTLRKLEVEEIVTPDAPPRGPQIRLWTDSFSNVVEILK